jgi:hypothetical protein
MRVRSTPTIRRVFRRTPGATLSKLILGFPIAQCKAQVAVNDPDVFNQAVHDHLADIDRRYFGGLMSPEEEQRETWNRDAHEAHRKGLACILYDEWPNAPEAEP